MSVSAIVLLVTIFGEFSHVVYVVCWYSRISTLVASDQQI